MARSLSDLERGAIVVLPSATFPESELRKIVAIQRYEERLLCTTLLLANPDLRLLSLPCVPPPPAGQPRPAARLHHVAADRCRHRRVLPPVSAGSRQCA